MTLEPVDTSKDCPTCGGQVVVLRTDEAALIRHGGYGATRTTVVRQCRCGWTVTASVGETRP